MSRIPICQSSPRVTLGYEYVKDTNMSKFSRGKFRIRICKGGYQYVMDTNMSKFPQGKFRIPICQGYEYVNLPPGEFSGDISEFFILINRVLFIICSITTK
jgi:hypothetical protein